MKSKLNVRLLRRIQKKITKHPELFDMSSWSHETSCGTSCCIGGWALILSGVAKPGGFCSFRKDGEVTSAQANSLPEAIALAAYRALGGKE